MSRDFAGRYTHQRLDGSGRVVREWRLYGCAKRGCDRISLDFESFGAGDKGYCLNHIPLWYRIKLWWTMRHE